MNIFWPLKQPTRTSHNITRHGSKSVCQVYTLFILRDIYAGLLCIAGTECGVHGAVSEYITVLSATELATCNAQNASLSGQCPPLSVCNPMTDFISRHPGDLQHSAETRQS